MLSGLVALLASGIVTMPSTATGDVLKPPVIHEVFTQLPCPAHPVSTLAEEGCYEKTIVRIDRKIDAEAKAIFGLLRTHAGRLAFVHGERSWLRYRQFSCAAEASKYTGGSAAPLVGATCSIARSKAHLRELIPIKMFLSFH